MKDLHHTLFYTQSSKRADFPPWGTVSMKGKSTSETKLKIMIMSELSAAEKQRV